MLSSAFLIEQKIITANRIVLRRALVGHFVYLGPLFCNFFFRKNKFEGTFLTDELAQ